MKKKYIKGSVSALGLFAFMVLGSCEKDDGKVETGCGTSTEYLSVDITNFKLKKNSYWVYVDSVSLAIDSMYVDSVLYSGVYPIQSNCATETFEGYGFTMKSSVDPSKTDYYHVKGGKIDRNIGNSSEVNTVVYVDYSFGKLDASSTNTLERKDSVFIYDRYYKKVEVMTHLFDKTELNKTIYYSNAEFGFLKKEIYNASNTLLSRKILMRKNLVR
ncbi:MAG TPA: hypothetical protein VGF30_11545 [Bacteroidia bacterium]